MSNIKLENMKTKTAMAINQDKLAKQRTELSVTRTKLAFYNSKMSLNQTHLAYLRTIVTLIGTAATIYKALPALGVSNLFSTLLASFLLLFACYFIYKDASVYPKMKQELEDMERKTNELNEQIKDEVFEFDLPE